MSGLTFTPASNDQQSLSLINVEALLKQGIYQELVSHLSICFTVLHMTGRSKMNEKLPSDTTPNRMLL